MIYFRRGIADHVDVFRDEILTIGCPLTDQACLSDESELAWANRPFATHRSVPLLNVADSLESSVKTPHDDESLDPKEQTRCEELVNGITNFLDPVTAAAPCKMLRPELTCVSQRISYV